MATINSLLDIDEESCRELNARELIAEKGQGKRVAIVGHFPFIPELREIAKELWVIEKNPREGDFTEDFSGGAKGNVGQLIPEPSSLLLVIAGGSGILMWERSRHISKDLSREIT